LGSQETKTWLSEHESKNAILILRDQPESSRHDGVLLSESESPGSDQWPAHIRLRPFPGMPGDDMTFPLEHVREVKVHRRALGALEGALIGVGLGILSGMVVGSLSNPVPNGGDCWFQCSTGGLMLLWAEALGITGVALGGFVGMRIGHRDVLTF
jgi:hypothetical protein